MIGARLLFEAKRSRKAGTTTGREDRMFARVSSYDGPAGLSDEEVEQITKRTLDEVMPSVRQMGGFRGIMSLLDRGSGKSLTITLWDSQADMQASEDAANAARAQAAAIADEQIRNVDRFEVTFQEMP
jgi:heme-degrading monooxygenase HmoA